jgi:hypothetical protein
MFINDEQQMHIVPSISRLIRFNDGKMKLILADSIDTENNYLTIVVVG